MFTPVLAQAADAVEEAAGEATTAADETAGGVENFTPEATTMKQHLDCPCLTSSF